MLRRWLPVGLALAVVAGAVAWALAGLPGAPAACPAAGCDCERTGPGPIRQPANAWSSLALAAAGIASLASARRRIQRTPSPPALSRWCGRGSAAAFALVLAGTAAFLFHAGLSAWAARLDGIAAGALVAALALHAWWARHRAACCPLHEAASGAAGSRPDTKAASLLPRCRGGGSRMRGAWAATLLPWLLLAGGGVCWALGRSGGPWCRPGSLLQAHAAWHLLAACAIFLWLRRGHSEDGGASAIPPRHLPSRREGEASHEPAP